MGNLYIWDQIYHEECNLWEIYVYGTRFTMKSVNYGKSMYMGPDLP